MRRWRPQVRHSSIAKRSPVSSERSRISWSKSDESGDCSKMKRKVTKKERSERARIEAENSPIVRQLRRLYDRGMAELEERRKLDPSAR
jgi:hypothetical protein